MRIDGEVFSDDYHFGSLQFDDGGMRGLGAALCWVGLVYRCSREPPEQLRHPGVKALASSLLSLPCIHKTQSDDPTAAAIQRIIKQNVDSKKLPVSSFEWSQILGRFAKEVSISDAIKMYNDSPEIHGHGGLGSKAWFLCF